MDSLKFNFFLFEGMVFPAGCFPPVMLLCLKSLITFGKSIIFGIFTY